VLQAIKIPLESRAEFITNLYIQYESVQLAIRADFQKKSEDLVSSSTVEKKLSINNLPNLSGCIVIILKCFI
jgi:hypothetical protein